MIYFLIGTIIVSTILILCYKTKDSKINLVEEEKTRREEMELNLNKEFQNRREEIEKFLFQEFNVKKQSIQNEIDDWAKSAQEAAEFNQHLIEADEARLLSELHVQQNIVENTIQALTQEQIDIEKKLETAKQSIAT